MDFPPYFVVKTCKNSAGFDPLRIHQRGWRGIEAIEASLFSHAAGAFLRNGQSWWLWRVRWLSPILFGHHFFDRILIYWFWFSHVPMISVHIMWMSYMIKQCHTPPMTGNGKHTTYMMVIWGWQFRIMGVVTKVIATNSHYITNHLL